MSVSGSATKVSSEPTTLGRTTGKFLLALVACIAVLVTGAAAADAATRLVAAGGTDAGDCTVSACATVQYAIDQSVATDTVDIGPGTFTSTGNTVSTPNLTVQGAGVDTTFVEGAAAGNLMFNLLAGSDGFVLSDLTVKDGGAGVYTDVAVDDVLLQDVEFQDQANYGVDIHNNADATNWTLTRVDAHGAQSGLRVRGSAGTMVVDESSFRENSLGFSSVFNSAGPGDGTTFDGLTVTNSSFNNNSQQGIYMEKLSNASFDGISVLKNSQAPATPTNGIDINLKYGAYSNIEIINSTVAASGGAGIHIKGRNDGASYSPPNDASLDNVDVNDNLIVDNGATQLLFGNKVTDITATGNNIQADNQAGMIGYADPDGPNEMNANNNWWNCNTLPTDTPTPPCMGFGIAPGSTPIDVTPWSTTPYFTERYVATTGSDAGNSCLIEELPCATVQRAVTVSYPGDTINIADGSYPETNITVNKQLDFVGESEAGASRSRPAAWPGSPWTEPTERLSRR